MTHRTAPHHVYLIPGLFGFGKLAGYDYFLHLERALRDRFERAGVELKLEVVSAPPTASITARARVLTHTVAATVGRKGPIHLLGHSTGGLDARLLLAPSTKLELSADMLDFRPRVRSIVGINTPHYGTPLAAYFTTAAGTRLLYILSLFTVTTLSLGRVPLSVFENVLATLAGLERRLGMTTGPLDELGTQVLRFVDARGRAELSEYLHRVRRDQAGIIQLMPEVMELFNSVVHDNPSVRYGCIATAAPAPAARSLVKVFGSPFSAAQLAVYTTVYGVASRTADRYPYAKPTREQAMLLEKVWPSSVVPEQVDGIVPTLSMLWGELLWCGVADHLDVVGHFDDGSKPRTHVDWLRSGAHFSRPSFAAMVDALCAFMLRD